MKFHKLILLIILIIVTIPFACKKCEQEPLFDERYEQLPINKLQVIGSHNSYRLRTDDSIFAFVQSIQNLLPAGLTPEAWDYTHITLPEQFSQYAIRSIELDIYPDPNGGLFYHRFGYSFVGRPTASNEPELLQRGYKVLHIPDFDFETNYLTFKSALYSLKQWSDTHPTHIPIFVLIESKEESVLDYINIPGLTETLDFTPALADSIDVEIQQVFGANSNKIFTPDALRGNYTTVKQAVENANWPTLQQMRGKIIFIMEGPAVDDYEANHPNLANRMMFTYGSPNEPETAFVLQNSAKTDLQRIQQHVRNGYIVRTRADSDTEEARNGDYSTMNAAFASGAQIISTDYYQADYRADTSQVWTDYKVQFPEQAPARVNPLFNDALRLFGGIKE